MPAKIQKIASLQTLRIELTNVTPTNC